ncbi:type III-A CRISPR-associated RAMP protein Csm4 [Dissulfurispira thermophila]|uniref:CRISPR system Cms protein Csm4 n=1 Tax=Dissulfurispira thermophila TaxID=2715679 RepID=A0A7G1H370_9BACT|nr:type III-A CRISPR-associated RAMP protein Csm4 [Dissulfurispira thermophila]BCB96601.1 type III-A CRISPR-associated RAMP protein Csm4 [Dissulfurispira thermophila]
MEVYLFKLRFRGPVHFGDTGIDLENVQETVSSDTLFSALMNTISIYYERNEAEDLIEKFINNPPFIFTSLFVYHKGLYFLPKPMDDTFISEDTKRLKGKELKKLKWLEISDFLNWHSQSNLTDKDISNMQQKQSLYTDAFVREIRPRVVLDRITQQSSIYHCGYIYFKKNAGLYGLVAFSDKGFIEKFKNILYLLGQTGIGGERTYGCGTFKIESFEPVDSTFNMILHTNTDKYTILSLYHPAQDERQNLRNNLLSYDIIRKKGWITTGRKALTLKRKSVGFITEGSVSKGPLKGCLVDITPDNPPPDTLSHRVYRYGYAFTAPLPR